MQHAIQVGDPDYQIALDRILCAVDLLQDRNNQVAFVGTLQPIPSLIPLVLVARGTSGIVPGVQCLEVRARLLSGLAKQLHDVCGGALDTANHGLPNIARVTVLEIEQDSLQVALPGAPDAHVVEVYAHIKIKALKVRYHAFEARWLLYTHLRRRPADEHQGRVVVA